MEYNELVEKLAYEMVEESLEKEASRVGDYIGRLGKGISHSKGTKGRLAAAKHKYKNQIPLSPSSGDTAMTRGDYKDLKKRILGRSDAVDISKNRRDLGIGGAVLGTGALGGGVALSRKGKAQEKAAEYYEEAQLIKQAAEEAYYEAQALEEAAIEAYEYLD